MTPDAPLDPSPSTREKSRFLPALTICIVLGVLLVAAVEIPDVPRGLRDAGLVLGGALIGLVSLAIDEKLRAEPARHASRKQLDGMQAELSGMTEQRLRETRLQQVTADYAFYLGYWASTLPLEESTDGALARVRECCDNLGLQFGAGQNESLSSPPQTLEQARELSEMFLEKGRNLGPSLRCFLQMGNTVAWLSGQLEQWHRTHAVVRRLETLAENPFLQGDARYASIVSELIDVLEPNRRTIDRNEQQQLAARVRTVLNDIPSPTAEDSDLRLVDTGSEWLWASDNSEIYPVRFLGPYTIAQRDPNLYEVSAHEDLASKVRVTRNAAGWHCDAHPDATEMDPCPEIEVALDATDGGQPVTEARLIPVRYGKADPSASEST